jgi:4-amino-4-deoxy-L-arabinose transferase-like glycosyltransferase
LVALPFWHYFLLANQKKNARFGLIWALIYFGSFTPHLYFKSGIIDPTFNLFIFLGIYFIYKVVDGNKFETIRKNWKYAIFSGIFIGLAVLTKGPVGALICLLTVLFYWAIFAKFKPIAKLSSLVLFLISSLLVASLWFANELISNGFWFLKEFIIYQISLFTSPVAGHGQPIYYHFVVVLLGCFPMSVLALPVLFKSSDSFGQWMKVTFWVVMILFSITTTKIVHYSSMAYFPLSFIAANFLFEWVENRVNWPKWQMILFLFIGFLFSLVLFSVPFLGNNLALISPYIKDLFTLKNLEAKANWQGTEMLIGVIYFTIIVLLFLLFINRKSKKWPT